MGGKDKNPTFDLFAHTSDDKVELSFLAYLRGRCRTLPQVEIGIGDDAAVLQPVSGKQVVTTDQIIEGTDFLADHDRRDVGYKSMAINLTTVLMGLVPCMYLHALEQLGVSKLT